MQDTWIQSLGWEDSLEEGMATHSSILAWKISVAEEPGGLQLQRVGHKWVSMVTDLNLSHSQPLGCRLHVPQQFKSLISPFDWLLHS